MKINNKQEMKIILECSTQEIRTVLSGLRQACAASRLVAAPDRDPMPCQLYWDLADFWEANIDPSIEYPQDRIELLRTLDRVGQNPDGMVNGNGRSVSVRTAMRGDVKEPNTNREEEDDLF